MAKTKAALMKEAKELGLTPKATWSVYELEHRIADKKAEIDREKAAQKEQGTAKTPKTTTTKRRGEY